MNAMHRGHPGLRLVCALSLVVSAIALSIARDAHGRLLAQTAQLTSLESRIDALRLALDHGGPPRLTRQEPAAAADTSAAERPVAGAASDAPTLSAMDVVPAAAAKPGASVDAETSSGAARPGSFDASFDRATGAVEVSLGGSVDEIDGDPDARVFLLVDDAEVPPASNDFRSTRKLLFYIAHADPASKPRASLHIENAEPGGLVRGRAIPLDLSRH